MADDTVDTSEDIALDDSITDEQYEQYFKTQGTSLSSETEGQREEETPTETKKGAGTEVGSDAHQEKSDAAVEEEVPDTEEKDKGLPGYAAKAIKEERERRREAEERSTRLEETFRQVMEKIRPPEESQAPKEPELPVAPPVYEEDPDGHRDWLVAKLKATEAQLADVNTKVTTVEGATAQNQYAQQLQQAAVAAEQAFVAKGHEDYPQALQHLVNQRSEEYRIRGFTPEQSQEILTGEFWHLVSNHLQQNKNPAEAIYALAKHTGYKSPEKSNGASGKSSGTLDNIEKGMQQSKSVGAVSNSIPDGADLTLEVISKASPAEFDKLWSDYAKQAKSDTAPRRRK